MAFRNGNATAIQRLVRGMLARVLFKRTRAKALVARQMLFYIARCFLSSARVAKRIREEMRRKHVRNLPLR